MALAVRKPVRQRSMLERSRTHGCTPGTTIRMTGPRPIALAAALSCELERSEDRECTTLGWRRTADVWSRRDPRNYAPAGTRENTLLPEKVPGVASR